MPASKAQQRAVSKYMKENYDEIRIRMEKGRKAVTQAHAQAQGERVNGFVNQAIELRIRELGETMDRDRQNQALLLSYYL